jgi:hypothetical protein
MHAVTPGHLVQVFRLGHRNAGRDQQRRATLDATGDFQRRGDLLRRQGNDRQIGLGMGQVGQRSTQMDVHEHQRTGKPLRPQGVMQSPRLRCL